MGYEHAIVPHDHSGRSSAGPLAAILAGMRHRGRRAGSSRGDRRHAVEHRVAAQATALRGRVTTPNSRSILYGTWEVTAADARTHQPPCMRAVRHGFARHYFRI